MSHEERTLWLIDTTTLYFEARQNDRELKALSDAWEVSDTDPTAKPPRRCRPDAVNEPAFRMQGHNKDGHPGDPQVVIVTECTPGGYVLAHKTYPGNTRDTTVTKAIIAELPRPRRGVDRVLVGDAGMFSAELMASLDAKGWKRLSAEGPLALQPCYHRTTERIEAHVMLTILAGNCVRYLERHTEMTFRQLSDLFGGLMACEMADEATGSGSGAS